MTTKKTHLFIQILWPEMLEQGDIQIIEPPATDKAGVARLQTARPGAARADAPNSLPLKSRSGAPVGYVAHVKYMEEPYEHSYIIK